MKDCLLARKWSRRQLSRGSNNISFSNEGLYEINEFVEKNRHFFSEYCNLMTSISMGFVR